MSRRPQRVNPPRKADMLSARSKQAPIKAGGDAFWMLLRVRLTQKRDDLASFAEDHRTCPQPTYDIQGKCQDIGQTPGPCLDELVVKLSCCAMIIRIAPLSHEIIPLLVLGSTVRFQTSGDTWASHGDRSLNVVCRDVLMMKW